MVQTVGEIIEELISVKDRLSPDLWGTEIDAINNACNILNHNFDRMTTSDKLTEV